MLKKKTAKYKKKKTPQIGNFIYITLKMGKTNLPCLKVNGVCLWGGSLSHDWEGLVGIWGSGDTLVPYLVAFT